jgi:hypothetical protein
MFPLGHVGIALGIAFVIARYTKKSWNPKVFVVLVGVAAVLPDMIDKPTGLLYGLQGGGRLFGHTILFSLAVLVAALLLWRFPPKQSISNLPLYFSLGVWTHLMLDLMWEDIEILLWPAYGLAFPTGGFSWGHLTDSPYAIAGEILGAVVIVLLALLILLDRFNPEGPESASGD